MLSHDRLGRGDGDVELADPAAEAVLADAGGRVVGEPGRAVDEITELVVTGTDRGGEAPPAGVLPGHADRPGTPVGERADQLDLPGLGKVDAERVAQSV